MNGKMLCFFLGRLAVLEGIMLILPLSYALWYSQEIWQIFAASSALSIGMGFIFNCLGKGHPNSVKVLESAFFMMAMWPFLALLGALPFSTSGWLRPIDAFLMSMSDVTSVGISLLPHDAPYALRLWEGSLMWLGGLCFIFMLVTLLPLVSGCFGMELSIRQGYTFSPMLGRMKLLSGKAVFIYCTITVFSIVLFSLSGLLPWDALQMAMRCVSTGGGDYFPNRDSYLVEQAAMISMLLAGGNLLLYLQVISQKNSRILYRNSEVKVFFQLVIAAGLAVAFHLYSTGEYYALQSLQNGFFHMLSFLTTTGLQTTALEYWPDFDIFFLLLLTFTGGCIGSVTGGMKIIRVLTLFKIAAAETKRTLHPHMIANVRISGVSIPPKIVGRMLSYFFMYILTFFFFAVLLSISGEELSVAVAMSFSCMTGVGHVPTFCQGDTFLMLTPAMKLLCCLIMPVGRIEIFGFLLLFQAGFNRSKKKW